MVHLSLDWARDQASEALKCLCVSVGAAAATLYASPRWQPLSVGQQSAAEPGQATPERTGGLWMTLKPLGGDSQLLS